MIFQYIRHLHLMNYHSSHIEREHRHSHKHKCVNIDSRIFAQYVYGDSFDFQAVEGELLFLSRIEIQSLNSPLCRQLRLYVKSTLIKNAFISGKLKKRPYVELRKTLILK